MNKLTLGIWHKFKTQPDLWFFGGFLLTFTLSIRKVIFYFPLQETFNEYTGIYVYISDIFLILTIVSWIISLIYNKYTILSSYKVVKLWTKNNIHTLSLLPPLTLVLWSFISIIWAENHYIATFRSIKLLELYFLYLYVISRLIPVFFTKHSDYVENVSNQSYYENKMFHVEHSYFTSLNAFRLILAIIIFSGSVQSIIGIAQFIFQNSIGLQFIRESILNANMPGVAKIILDGHKYIRAYGLMPHPNILGGFLISSILITIFYLKLFHVEQFKSLLISEKPYIFKKKWLNNTKWLIKALIIIQSLALLLTFSKSAILGLIIAFIYIRIIEIDNKNVPPASSTGRRGTFFKSYLKLFHVEQFRIIILSATILLITFLLILKPDFYSFLIQPIKERWFYIIVPRGTIIDNWLLGIGSGQFVLNLSHFSENVILFWQYQPIHNIFLLIWAELGIIGLGLFIWWLWNLFHSDQIIHSANFSNSDNLLKTDLDKNLPFAKIKECSTWNIPFSRDNGVEQFHKLEQERKENINELFILNNKFNKLSSSLILIYFKAILLSFVFIMLFDHYLWDIWQGQVLFWMTAGVLAGLKNRC
jgi:hypothetical protein